MPSHILKMQEKSIPQIFFKSSFNSLGNPCRPANVPAHGICCNRNCRKWRESCVEALLETSVGVICLFSCHSSLHSTFLWQSVHLEGKWPLLQEIYEISTTWNDFWQSRPWASADPLPPGWAWGFQLRCHPLVLEEHVEPVTMANHSSIIPEVKFNIASC